MKYKSTLSSATKCEVLELRVFSGVVSKAEKIQLIARVVPDRLLHLMFSQVTRNSSRCSSLFSIYSTHRHVRPRRATALALSRGEGWHDASSTPSSLSTVSLVLSALTRCLSPLPLLLLPSFLTPITLLTPSSLPSSSTLSLSTVSWFWSLLRIRMVLK